MATCSITDSFIVDADTFYVAVNIATEAAAEKKTDTFESQESSIKVNLLKSDDIKIAFGSE